MPGITICQMFGSVPIYIIYSFPVQGIPQTTTFTKYKSLIDLERGKKMFWLPSLAPSLCKCMTLFPSDLETWDVKYIQAHTFAVLKGILMKVFARFWDFPKVGAGCWLALIVTARILRIVGILRYSETNLEPVCYQHRLFRCSGIQ